MRRKFCRATTFFSAFVFVFTVWMVTIRAGEPAGANLDVETLVSEGMANNFAIRAARQDEQSAKLMVRPAGVLPDPTLKVGVEAIPVDTLSFNREPMTQKIIGVTQPLPYPGKLKLSRAVAESDAQAAGYKARIIENQVAFEVRKTFYEWAFAVESLRITQENINVMDEFTDIATSNYSVGKSAQWDVLQAQVERAKFSKQSVSLKKEIESIKAMLAKTLGRDPLRVDGTPEVKWTPVVQLDEEEFFKRADAKNPELAYLRAGADKAENEAQLARKRRLPDFAVTLTYGMREDVTMDGTTQKQSDLVSAMFEIMLPLYASRKQIPAAESARGRVLSARQMLQDGRLMIHAQIRDRVLAIRQADEVEKLYRTAILPQARTAIESAVAGYRVGKLDFLSLLKSQLSLSENELDYYEVRINRETDFAALALLTGEPVAAENNNAPTGGDGGPERK